jgi:hypothetical protein
MGLPTRAGYHVSWADESADVHACASSGSPVVTQLVTHVARVSRQGQADYGYSAYMSAINCPFCGAFVDFKPVWETRNFPPATGMANSSDRKLAAQKCSNDLCQMIVMTAQFGNQIVRTWPDQVGGKSFPDVPDHIAEAADEAYRCYSIGAFRASTLLARSVVEATAKAKGITQGNLMNKIEEMFSQGHIREFVRDGAHEVRYLGNDMAHGDFVDPVAPEEAELALALVDEVLDEIFQAPARVAKARAARLQKKQEGTT